LLVIYLEIPLYSLFRVQNCKERSEVSVRGLGEGLKVGGSKKRRFGAKRKFRNTFGVRNPG